MESIKFKLGIGIMKKTDGRKQGFTLLELLVGMVVFGIVIGAVYSTYYTQQRSYVVQTEISHMEQNLRAAILLMATEIRMAGCDPTGAASRAGILDLDNCWDPIAERFTSITFAMDLRGQEIDDPPDGDTSDPDENIHYALYDSDEDGVNDALGRDAGSGMELVAENIDALDFVYLDENGAVIDLNENGAVTNNTGDIRSVQISIVARTEKPDPNYVNTNVYKNQQGKTIFGPPNDHYRRRLLTLEVRCRNMGLK